MKTNRQSIAGVSSELVDRWSPRAFSSEPVSDEILTRLIEAARWSPSCFNEQPWRFYTSNTETFEDYLGLLVDVNQQWASNAPVIGFLVGKKQFAKNGKDNSSYALDCGAAWMAMTVQAVKEGLYTHGMAGIKHEAIAEYFKLDTETEAVMMGFALGKIGDPGLLDENFREKEQPSDRMPLSEIWLAK